MIRSLFLTLMLTDAVYAIGEPRVASAGLAARNYQAYFEVDGVVDVGGQNK